jgi:hypothetical protein
MIVGFGNIKDIELLSSMLVKLCYQPINTFALSISPTLAELILGTYLQI